MLRPAVRPLFKRSRPARSAGLVRIDPEALQHHPRGLRRLARLQASQHVDRPDRKPGNAAPCQHMLRIGQPRQHRRNGQAVHRLVKAPDDARLAGLQVLHLIDQQAKRTLPTLRREHLAQRPEPGRRRGFGSPCAAAAEADGAATGLRAPEPCRPARGQPSRDCLRNAVGVRQFLQMDRKNMRRRFAGLRPYLRQMGKQGRLAGPRRSLNESGGAGIPPTCRSVAERRRRGALNVVDRCRASDEERRNASIQRLAGEAQSFEVRFAAHHGRPFLRAPGRPQRRMRKSLRPERSSPRMRKSVRAEWSTRPLSRARPAAVSRSNTEVVGM